MTENTSAPPARFLHAASESCADMLHACRMMIPDPFLWYSVDGQATIVVSALEVGRARKHAPKGLVVLSVDEAKAAWGMEDKASGAASLLLGLAKHTDVTTWEVPESLPYGLAKKLLDKGLQLETVSSFFPERAIKTEAEIELVREGVRLSETGLARAEGLLRAATIGGDEVLRWNGAVLTAEILRGEVDAAIARAGGTASHTITAPGVQGADPHQAGTGPIRAHEPIVLDIFPRVDRTGYHGDLTRTLVKGHATDVVQRAFEAVRMAQQTAIDTVKAGVKAADVHNAADAVLKKAGFETDSKADPPHGFFHGLGHGLGLEIHEVPRVSARADNLLIAGHVVTMEPGLYYPEWGGIRIEDVVAVTEDGCQNLTTADIHLEIA